MPAVPNQATIIWNDTALPYAGIVSPGDYQFRINVAGYEQSGLLTLSCPATNTQSACTFSGPGVSGGIVTLARFPLLANGTWSVAPADSSVQPTIQVTAAPSGAGPITVTPNADGTLTWSETGLPIDLVRPGPLSVGDQRRRLRHPHLPVHLCPGDYLHPTESRAEQGGTR